MLRLADDGSSSSGSSPSTPTLMMDDIRPTYSLVSSVRDLPLDPYNTGLPSQGQDFSPDDSPFPSVDDGLGSEVMLASYSTTLPPITSSHSLVSSWPPQSNLLLCSSSTPSTFSLSPSYLSSCYGDDNDDLFAIPSVNDLYLPPPDNLVQHYMHNVLKLQYLLADQNLFSRLMQHSTETSDVAHEAVCLLSSVHRWKVQNRGQGDDGDIDGRYHTLRAQLLRKRTYNINEAMAVLHIISSLLFVGGTGDWPQWLNVAYIFVDSMLRHPRSPSPAKILMTCNDDLRYIIKTAMWFDVLASACLFVTPHFLQEYRTLFEPPTASIDSLPPVSPPELSMLSVMGCENHVVWALAEVTELQAWKEIEQSFGRLSVPELVARGLKIDKHIQCRTGPPLAPKHDDIEYHRYVTSDVFRASTRVYLHSVLSGDHPSCPEIVAGVDDTIRCLDRVPDTGGVGTRSRTVVRSVVFSIFICGCLTDDLTKRDYFLRRLAAQETETVGNCSAIKSLMLQVWDDRSSRGLEEPVRWREFLKKSGILLV